MNPFALPPASKNILMISNGEASVLPGCTLTGAPVASFAAAAAWIACLSTPAKSQKCAGSYVGDQLTMDCRNFLNASIHAISQLTCHRIIDCYLTNEATSKAFVISTSIHQFIDHMCCHLFCCTRLDVQLIQE